MQTANHSTNALTARRVHFEKPREKRHRTQDFKVSPRREDVKVYADPPTVVRKKKCMWEACREHGEGTHWVDEKGPITEQTHSSQDIEEPNEARHRAQINYKVWEGMEAQVCGDPITALRKNSAWREIIESAQGVDEKEPITAPTQDLRTSKRPMMGGTTSSA